MGGRQFDVVFTDPYTVAKSSDPNAVVVSSDFETTWQANAEYVQPAPAAAAAACK